MSYDLPASTPIPADIELPDKILAGLTARQVAIITAAAVIIWAGFEATRHLMPLPVFAAMAAPVALAATALVIGQRDGLSLDRLLIAAWRQARSPRRLVTAPGGVSAPPAWAGSHLARRQGAPPAPLDPLYRSVAGDGVIGLGDSGAAVAAAVSTVNFALRTPAEQDALTAAFGRWLNSLTGPAQILIRAGRADLTAAVTALEDAAPALPHPALEDAALGHAAFLAGLAEGRDLLTRQVLLVVREPHRAGPAAARASGAAARAAQRGAEAARLLGAADLTVSVLDGGQVTALLAAAADPGADIRAEPARRALPARHQPGDPVMRLPGALRRHARAAAPGTAADPVPGPPSVEVAARHLRIGDDYAATLAVTGYPAEVCAGWLEPLLTYPGRLDVALHIDPVPPAAAADRLRRQRARLESGRRASAGRGQLDDPETEAAADDARELAYRIARGEGRLFRLGLYLTVHAASEDDLAEEIAAVRALASSLLLVTCPATFRSVQGWVTTLPAGTDALKLTRTMDTAALAAAFPFTSPDLPRDPADPGALPGILYGANTAGPGLVAWDRWAQDNHNSVTLACSGAGKSYLAKLEILRNAYQGTQCWIIDPEDEYARLAAATGGACLHLGADGVRLNPFDLPAPAPGTRPAADTLTRRALFAHTVTGVLLGGQPGPAERAALDRAIMAAYHRAGITADPRTWTRPAPQLPDLAAALRAGGGEAAVMLADRLAPFTEGTHSGMFAGPTTTRPAGHLVVFSLRDVPGELKAVATLLALDAVWRQVSDPAARRRRLVVVDEAWLLMRDPEGARFLFRMAKAARKHWAALAVVTQDAEDVLGSDLGRAVISNAATQVLLRQAPQAIGLAADAFGLSAGEQALLLSAGRGEGLLACGPSARVSFQALASPAEHALCTSDPAELAGLETAGYAAPWQDPGAPAGTPPRGYPDPDEDSLP